MNPTFQPTSRHGSRQECGGSGPSSRSCRARGGSPRGRPRHAAALSVLLALAALTGPAAQLAAEQASTGGAVPQQAVTPQPPVEDVAALRADADGDFVPDRLGETVRVHGVIISERRMVGRGNDAMFFQDATSGITLFAPDTITLAGLEPGDSVHVVGELSQHHGAEEIHVSAVRLLGRAAMPEPVDVSARALLGERYAGQLVRVRGRIFVGDQDNRLRLVVEDTSGRIPIYLRSDYLEDEEFVRALYSARSAEVVGIASQSVRTPPYTSGYDLIPRSPQDFTLTPAPPVAEMAVFGGMALLVLLLGYVYMRRRSAEQRADRLRRLKEDLERRDGILQAVAFAAERFLVEDEFEAGLAEAVKRLRLAARAAACSMLELSGHDGRWRLVVHDRRPDAAGTGTAAGAAGLAGAGDAPPRADLAELDRTWGGDPELERWLDALGPAEVARVSPSDAETGKVLERHGGSRLLLVPIMGGSTRWGALVLYYDAAQPLPSGPELEALKAAGSIIGAAASRREALATLRERDEQLRQSQKLEAVGRLAGGIAHDFNNLLTAIGGNAALLTEASGLTPEARREAEEVVRASQRAAHLTQQLLAFSRHQVLPSKRLDASAVVLELRPMLDRLIGEDIRLVTDVPTPAWIDIPPGQLEQVIVNLCVNSRDAMPDGGTLRIATRTATESDGEVVVLEVSDTGIGIDQETLGYVFEPFFTTKSPESGTGLGLSTVYGIVNQAGGSIRLDTQPGRGTRAVLTFPAAPCGLEPEEHTAPPSVAPAEAATILVAEDEPAVRQLAQRVLERCGYTVMAAPDGDAALALLRQHGEPVHLLLTDVRMPGMNGKELAGAARALQAEIRVLYMSGYAANELRVGEIAAADFLEKPFSPDELVERVHEIMNRPAASLPRRGAIAT